MTTIGPYEFTDQDVGRTLSVGRTLFDLLTDGLAPVAVDAAAPFRSQAEAALGELAAVDPAAALGAFWEAWRSAMDAIRTTGAFGPPDIGTVSGLFRSDGGVPKQPREAVEVDHAGVVGDRQNDRANHGRPWQALCLWSTEAIDSFRSEGHPLAPGRAGENISITGLAWERVRPGARLQIGDVVAEVSAYAVPCSKNAAWFVGGRFDAMHHRHGPRSRVYATVLEPGTVTVGAPVWLEPGA